MGTRRKDPGRSFLPRTLVNLAAVGGMRHVAAPLLAAFSSANAELIPGLSLAEPCPEVELSHHQSSACEGSGNLAALSVFFSFQDKCPGMSVNMWKFAYLLGYTEVFVFHSTFS